MSHWTRRILEFILTFLNIKISESNINNIVQFIMFGIVGVSNTVISYVLNIMVLMLLQPLNVGWDFVAGNVVAFALSVLWSFYWNNKYVFSKSEDEERSIWKNLMKTYISYSFTGIILNNVLSGVWIGLLEISKYVAPLLNLLISVPLNFLINKYWTFRAHDRDK